MVKREWQILILSLLIFSSPLLAAQHRKIAIIKSKDLSQFNTAIAGFKKGLQAGGVDSEILEADLSEGNKQTADKLKQFAPDLIVPVGSTATRFAQDYFNNTPIVFAMVLYPVLSGVVHETSSSSTVMITGASMDIPVSKQFETIRAVIPRATRIGVLYDPNETGKIIEEAHKAAKVLGMDLVAISVRANKDVPSALDGIERKVDVLWAVADGTVFTPPMSEHILTYTLQHDLPFMGLSPAFVEAGAAFALSQDFEDIGRQAAEMSVRILDGADARQMEIAYPRKVSLFLNLRAADEIGVRIPQTVIDKAAKVIR